MLLLPTHGTVSKTATMLEGTWLLRRSASAEPLLGDNSAVRSKHLTFTSPVACGIWL